MAHCEKDLLFKFFSMGMTRGPGPGPRAQATKRTQMVGARAPARDRDMYVDGPRWGKDLDEGIYPPIPTHEDPWAGG